MSDEERAARYACESGHGFYSADETETSVRWMLAEIDRLRAALAEFERTTNHNPEATL